MSYQYFYNIDDDELTKDKIIKSVNPSKGVLITLQNDSILQYYKRYGGLGFSTKIKYYLNKGLIIVDSLDIYNRSSPDEIKEAQLIFSLDSLVDNVNGFVYFKVK